MDSANHGGVKERSPEELAEEAARKRRVRDGGPKRRRNRSDEGAQDGEVGSDDDGEDESDPEHGDGAVSEVESLVESDDEGGDIHIMAGYS